jgi:hypothetical protein
MKKPFLLIIDSMTGAGKAKIKPAFGEKPD